ncbi:KGGVGR-motif variant AAA ATPase [Prosthecobacter dejongeii]|uniref:MinD-like ATPase involved in chromosome partitioning or flagellar assembly n=1 Tax=Prosthecobacter dejongeii TaxID=48465 RepID=A0A7W7YKB4_9BACT|nr:hypothetical protein [Prosthecobacter dejongeii]MBB5037485.1 MinD-like ATPase involved in chromosome partitioning or flagellar assembly [Prosthecobacter dejongeii]
MNFQPRVFTFYSYKGGVGRSMAVLNTAYYLHARGRHVLVVDLDLEAPGASGFLNRTGELLPTKSQGDVVDVLAAVVQSVRDAPAGTPPELPPLLLESFLHSVDVEHYAEPKHPRAARARLDVLAADESRNYAARLSALNLPSLSAQQIFDSSDLLRAVLRNHRFSFNHPWQEEGTEPEPTGYDYILVDSRTGFTEVGGLCVGPLSDRLVVLSGLNDQNITGTLNFLNFVGLKPQQRSGEDDVWDEADPLGSPEPGPATLGPKPTLLVASPVPGGEMTYKKDRMEVLKKQIGLAPLRLSYHPQMALMETIFIRDYPDEYLAMEYSTLADRVMAMVGDSNEQLRASVHRLIRPKGNKSNGDPEWDGNDLLKRMTRIAVSTGQLETVFPIRFLPQSGLPDSLQKQIRMLDINLAPTDEYAAESWLAWADALDTEEARRRGDVAVFQEMEGKYHRSILLKPDFQEALGNWGAALSAWATTKVGSEADELFRRAEEKHKQALAITSNKYIALNNWGTALLAWSQIKEGTENKKLLDHAEEKFQEALAIKADDPIIIYNLACLSGLKGEVETTLFWLESWRKLNSKAAKSKLDNDKDFDRVRNDPRFQAFRDSLID